MSIQKDILDLVNAEIISDEIADKIREYYRLKGSHSKNRLLIVFGILGSVLIGLGVILIIAHNWDQLSRLTKTIFAFVPLLFGQLFCVYALVKKYENVSWVESCSVFLFFSVGASISLISQIYNIPGNLSSFLLTWMLLCLPLVYVMRSSVTSLFYIIGITYYAAESNYWTFPSSDSYLYWILLLLILPHYYMIFNRKPNSNFTILHNWLLPLSVVITLGTLAHAFEDLMYISYINLFAIYYLVGISNLFSTHKTRYNSYRVLGSLGTIILLLILSFDWLWLNLKNTSLYTNEIIFSPELFVAVISFLFAAILLYYQLKNKTVKELNPISFVFTLFIPTFLIGLFSDISVILINIFVLVIGILTIIDGTKKNHLGVLNFGLLIITALVICRFFDESLTFVLRGFLFVAVGIGFFATNYWILKKRKTNE